MNETPKRPQNDEDHRLNEARKRICFSLKPQSLRPHQPKPSGPHYYKLKNIPSTQIVGG